MQPTALVAHPDVMATHVLGLAGSALCQVIGVVARVCSTMWFRERRARMTRAESALVHRNLWVDVVAEQRQYLTGLSVTSGALLGKQHLAVDDDLECALAPGDHAQVLDDVLVVVQQLSHRAHGTVGVVSGHAVRELDAVAVRGHTTKPTVRRISESLANVILSSRRIHFVADVDGALARGESHSAWSHSRSVALRYVKLFGLGFRPRSDDAAKSAFVPPVVGSGQTG
jgi:hypothetical protein